LCYRTTGVDVLPVTDGLRAFSRAGVGQRQRGTVVKYQNMINELQTYADPITTPDIRRRSDRMVTINHEMFEQWKTWVAQSRARSSEPATPTSSDKQFGNQFAANARKLKLVHAELTAACPN
jgi:hypothetical protein